MEEDKKLGEITVRLNNAMTVEEVFWMVRCIFHYSDKVIIRGVGDGCLKIALGTITAIKDMSYNGEALELIDYQTNPTKTTKGDDREEFVYIYEKVRRTL